MSENSFWYLQASFLLGHNNNARWGLQKKTLLCERKGQICLWKGMAKPLTNSLPSYLPRWNCNFSWNITSTYIVLVVFCAEKRTRVECKTFIFIEIAMAEHSNSLRQWNGLRTLEHLMYFSVQLFNIWQYFFTYIPTFTSRKLGGCSERQWKSTYMKKCISYSLWYSVILGTLLYQ